MQLKIEKVKLKKINLNQVQKALQLGLSENFKAVKVEIIDCPNLKNWGCPAEGLSGNEKLQMLAVNLICMISDLLVQNLIMRKLQKKLDLGNLML